MKAVSMLTRALHPLFAARSSTTPYWDEKEEFFGRNDREEKIRLLEQSIRPDETGIAMDLGAGDGKWTHALASIFDDVIAVEPAPGPLSLLRQRMSTEGTADRRIRLLCATAERLAVQDDSVDVVFCHHVFQYLRQEVALAEMARILKPGGRLFLSSNGLGYFLLQIVLGFRHNRADKVEYGLKCLLGTMAGQVSGRRIVGQQYSSIPRLTAMAESVGLHIVEARPWESHSLFPLRYMGATTHFAILAEKPGQPALASPP